VDDSTVIVGVGGKGLAGGNKSKTYLVVKVVLSEKRGVEWGSETGER
jgi:hypothetical protein